MIDGKRVRIAIEGVGPLVHNVVRDQWERVDGRLVRASLPAMDRDVARQRLSLDDSGRPAFRWEQLLWLMGGKPASFDASTARREMGLDVEGGGLAIEGEWEPLRRPTSLFGIRGEEVVAVFPEWKASGVVAYDVRLWSPLELWAVIETSCREVFRLASLNVVEAAERAA